MIALPTLMPVRAVHGFQDRGRWLMPALGVVLAMGLGVVIGARPAWRMLKRYRSDQVVARAEVLADQGRWAEVAPLVKVALGLAPTDLRGNRLAARFLTAVRSPNALSHWQVVLASGKMTREERLQYAQITVGLTRPDLARPVLALMHAEAPNDPIPYRLEIELERRLKNESARVKVVERWLRDRPDDPEPQFELGRLRLQVQVPGAQDEGRRLLWGLAVSSSEFSLPAISLLAGQTNLSVVESRHLLRRIAEFPATNQLAFADIRLRLQPEERSHILAEVIGRVGEGASPGELQVVSSWLAQQGALKELLSLLTPERVSKFPVLEAARWQALIELGRNEELAPLLASPPPGMPPFLVHCLRASAAHTEGQTQATQAHLDQAVIAAGNLPMAHRFIAQFAERIRHPKVALDEWSMVALEFGGGYSAAAEVLRLAVQLDRVEAAQPVFSRLHDSMPSEAGITVVAAYLEALFEKTRPEMLTSLRNHVLTNTPDHRLLAVLGFYEWRRGDPQAALKTMESSGLDWSLADARSQASYVAVLGAAGQREAARSQAARIRRETLCREERALVDAWR